LLLPLLAKRSTLLIITDLHKVYIDDEHYNSGHGHAYERYGVDPNVGAVVVVRPDQCKSSRKHVLEQIGWCGVDVAKVTGLDDFEGIERFFESFLVERGAGVEEGVIGLKLWLREGSIRT
jgi:phenol 2-monooxygenase